MRTALTLVAAASLALLAAGSGAGRPDADPTLRLRIEADRECCTTTKQQYLVVFPLWDFMSAPAPSGAYCYAVHSTYGTLRPAVRLAGYSATRPPLEFAPVGGSWAFWKAVRFRFPSPGYESGPLNSVNGQWAATLYPTVTRVEGATVRAYIFDCGSTTPYASTEQFIRVPALVAKPGTKPTTKPTTKPGQKPTTKPGQKNPGKKSGARFTFTTRVSGKPSVGAERLFVSYQGSSGSAQGSFLTAAPVGNEADVVDASGSVSLVHDYSAFPDERYTLQLAAINDSFTKTFSNGRAVRVGIKVTASTFSGCPAGRTGFIVVSDLSNGDGFEVSLCGVRLVWVDGKSADVAVTIRAS